MDVERPPCTCPREEQSLGRLDGFDMGRGMVRLSTDPRCRVHNEHACAGQEATCTYCGAPRDAWIHPESRELFQLHSNAR